MNRFEDNPFLHSLGASIESWDKDHIVISMDLQPCHLNRQGVLQGGVVCALLDAACGYAGIRQHHANQNNAVTISLAVNFIGSTNVGRVLATGTIIGRGRKIFFSRGEVSTSDGRVLASAQGSFKFGSPSLAATTFEAPIA